MNGVLDRDALYYPYIHIHDVNWLKGTLLCFPQVRRMVPPDFYLNDSPEVQKLRTMMGPRHEPLIVEEDMDQPAVGQAQERLLSILKDNEEFIRQRYSHDAAIEQYPQDRDSFQIHSGKMIEGLADYLRSKELAWSARNVRGGYGIWYALHPKLGEALMSAIAINIALQKGLDIVTSSGQVHHALASLDEQEVFQNLVGETTRREPMGEPRRVGELTDELALMVMTTRFDLRRLSVEQIAEMMTEGKDLRRFKQALVPIAQSIPDILDPTERQKRLKLAAEEVIHQWNEYKRSLPRFALDALTDVSDIKIPEVVFRVIAGASTGLTLAVGFGMAIGFVTYNGYRVVRKYRERRTNPYQVLSRLEKAGMSLVTRPESLSAN